VVNLLLEGDDLEALLLRAHREGGSTARIVRAEKVRRGGILGFFAKEGFEVAVEIPADGEPPHDPPAGRRAPSTPPALTGRPDRPALPAASARPTGPESSGASAAPALPALPLPARPTRPTRPVRTRPAPMRALPALPTLSSPSPAPATSTPPPGGPLAEATPVGASPAELLAARFAAPRAGRTPEPELERSGSSPVVPTPAVAEPIPVDLEPVAPVTLLPAAESPVPSPAGPDEVVDRAGPETAQEEDQGLHESLIQALLVETLLAQDVEDDAPFASLDFPRVESPAPSGPGVGDATDPSTLNAAPTTADPVRVTPSSVAPGSGLWSDPDAGGPRATDEPGSIDQPGTTDEPGAADQPGTADQPGVVAGTGAPAEPSTADRPGTAEPAAVEQTGAARRSGRRALRRTPAPVLPAQQDQQDQQDRQDPPLAPPVDGVLPADEELPVGEPFAAQPEAGRELGSPTTVVIPRARPRRGRRALPLPRPAMDDERRFAGFAAAAGEESRPVGRHDSRTPAGLSEVTRSRPGRDGEDGPGDEPVDAPIGDAAGLAALGVPADWIDERAGGDRFGSILTLLRRLPPARIDPATAVVAVVGPVGSVELEAHRTALDLPVAGRPRRVTLVPGTAGVDRRSAIARSKRVRPVVVSVPIDGFDDPEDVRKILAEIGAEAVVVVLPATQPPAEVADWVRALDRVDALVLDGALDVPAPAAVLTLGLPVARVGGAAMDRTGWAALLCARLSAFDTAR
jgi:hypothetical protein